MKRLISIISVLLIISAVFIPGKLARAQEQNREALIKQIQSLIILIQELVIKLNSPSEVRPVSPLQSAVVQKSPILGPKIFSVLPQQGKPGTFVTLHGEGYSVAKDNIIYTGYGEVKVKSPDGETLGFVFNPPRLPSNLGALKTTAFPLLNFHFYVRNDNGLTENPIRFTLDL